LSNDPTKPVSKGDRHDNAPNVRKTLKNTSRFLVTSQYGSSPHTDSGVEVRRIFHKLRSLAIENFNEQFKGIFDVHGHVPTKGVTNTKRFALGAIFVYQMALLIRYQNGLPLRVGLKAFLKAIGNTRRYSCWDNRFRRFLSGIFPHRTFPISFSDGLNEVPFNPESAEKSHCPIVNWSYCP